MSNETLVKACIDGIMPDVYRAIKNGADIHYCYETPLLRALSNNRLNVAKFLIDRGADIEIIYNAAFSDACSFGHLNVVKFLVKCGMNIHHYYEDASIAIACQFGHFNIVKYLVEIGANIYAYDHIALRMALTGNHVNVAKFLISKGKYTIEFLQVLTEALNKVNIYHEQKKRYDDMASTGGLISAEYAQQNNLTMLPKINIL